MHDVLLGLVLPYNSTREANVTPGLRRRSSLGGFAPEKNMQNYPITIIVRHPRENPKKCTVLPLKGRADVQFLPYPLKDLPPFDGYIRLAADGPALSAADGAYGVLLLDGSWRCAGKMIAQFESVPPRSLSGWKTAYPRVSKAGTDPANGLASIEALYIAYHLLGRPTAGLLEHYHWAEQFLELNNLPKPRDEHSNSGG